MKVLVFLLCFFGLSLISLADSDCTAGWPIQNRNYVDSARYVTTVAPDRKFSCDGEVTEWQLQAKASQKVRAVVFRPIAGSNTKFNLVGFNDIPANQIAINKPIVYTVPEQERISVQAGDVIGWSVDRGVLAWNYNSQTTIRYQYNKIVTGFEGSPIDVASGSSGRQYSIQATVKPAGTGYEYVGCFIDTWTRAVPDHRMDSRDSQTNEMCAAHCQEHGSRYSSTQNGYACFCGSDGVAYDRFGEAPDSECNVACPGDATEKCGGAFRNSLYDLWGNGGPPPACNDVSDTTACTAGWAVKYRMLIDSASYITTVAPDRKFSCAGVVTEWQFQAKASHKLRAIVLRPVAGSNTKFTVVGFNDIPADQIPINTPVSYTVPCYERITVKAGDVIAWSVGKAVLNWNQASGSTIRYQYNKIVNGFESVVDIAHGSDGREYSIKATVKPFN